MRKLLFKRKDLSWGNLNNALGIVPVRSLFQASNCTVVVVVVVVVIVIIVVDVSMFL